MPSAQEILNDPNYTNANDATKQAIFDKHIATSSDYTNANNETKVAIRNRFGLKAGGPISNIVRTTTESVLPGLGGLTGAVAGASAMTPLAEGALIAGGPAGPFIAGALELGGAGLGAYLGAEGVGAIQDKLHQLIAPEDYVNRQLQRQQNPITTGVGQIAGGVVGLSPKVAVDTTAKIINTAMKARAASAAAQAGVSAGTQLATTGKVDPFETGVAAVTGAVLPGTNVIGAPFAGAGRAIGKTVADVVTGKKATSLEEEVQIPKEYTTPEQKKEFLERVKQERAAKAPLTEAALRNKETGELERMGPKHDQARKEATKDTHEEGFVDALGNFHERQAAVDQAKRAGQIPEDHVLENPEGERPGLHTSDLRKAGDKRFEITDTQAAGKPKDPITRDEHKQTIKDLKEQYSILDVQRQIAELNGLEEDRVKYESQQKELRTKIEDLKKAMPGVQFKDARVPTWEELHEHLYDAKNLGEAFDTILDSNVGTRGLRLLTKALNTSDFIRSAKLNLTPKELKVNGGKSAPGYYTPVDQAGKPGDTYSFHEGHTVNLGKDGSLQELLHEGIHAGTHRLIEEGRSAAAIKLKELYKKYLDTAYAEIHEPKLEAFREANPQATVKELEAFRQDNTPYGSTDVHEFISEAFTNKRFKRELSKVKTTTPEGVLSNLWKDFKDVIRESLNLPESERTLLDDVLDQGVALIKESEGFKAGEGYGQVAASAASKVTDLDKFKQEKIENYQKIIWENYESWLGYMPTKLKNAVMSATKDVMTPLELVKAYNKDLSGFDPIINSVVSMIKDTTTDPSLRGMAENYLAGKKSNLSPVASKYNQLFPPLDESKPTSSPDELTKDLAEKTTPEIAKAAQTVDVRSIPNEEEFYKHAAEIQSKYGDEEAIKFFEDYNKNLREQSIPVPNNYEELDDALHKVNTFLTRDRSENVSWYKENTNNGVTAEDRAKWFDMRERGEELPPEAKAVLDVIDQENLALVRKIKAMGGDVGEEFTKGQSRIRIFGDVQSNWLNTIKEFFTSGGPLGDKIAEQANAAIERKVYQLDDGRVVEIHRQNEDVSTPSRDIAKGTEIYHWTKGPDGKPVKRLIGHTPDLNFKRGDSIILNDGKKVTMVDGSVEAIERDSPYRYLHDAEASARLANIGLRKMARELELVNNLKKSELFKQVGFSPEQPVKDLPQGWRVPNNIDRIPELRGWHFDPKTAAIIEDFAKVWDNTMWMKLSNALVKNMMLNPIPHMFNEVMHLWNARGFTGWVMPGRLGTFADTARQAWNDVGNQSKFYRDIMREGGSILGADPRNKEYFEPIFENAKKEAFGDKDGQRSISLLAKRLGTSVGDLYNGISKASNKAMWFTRDVMYVQYIREIMSEANKRGMPIDLKGAIKEAERHMPNYRLPSEVLGSRGLSQVLRNPNISMFSRYHYGMVKSLVNTIRDVDPRNLSSPEGRKHFREGVDSMLAIGVAMGALYPLMDYIAESMFGEGAEQRRAGPYHLIQAGMDVATNKKDASALIWPVFTFNPVLLSLGQLAFNKNIFTGKSIYHPDDPLGDILGDVGEYAAKQVPQVSTAMSATKDEGGETQLLAKQLDIKAKTPKQLAREKRAKELQAKATKGRATKRQKGEYIP